MSKAESPELEEQRSRRRESILDAAEGAFLEVDFPAASMSAIAAAAGVSRPTLYKYFPTIDDLAFAVQERALGALMAIIEPRLPNAGTNAAGDPRSGLERIESLLRELVAHFDENRAHLRFMGLFDHWYNDSYGDEARAEGYKGFLARFDAIESLVRLGQRDGSVRACLDAHAAAYAAGNAFLATMHRFAARGDIITREQRVDIGGQFEELIRMILAYAGGGSPRQGEPHARAR